MVLRAHPKHIQPPDWLSCIRLQSNISATSKTSKNTLKTLIRFLKNTYNFSSLQSVHSNYNYEDFIAGMHIEDKSSVVMPGYLLNLIEKIKADPLPHILILDEINRTDISRLFGELFSALEYRNKKIRLSIGDLEIALPANLYFIGTMNEIDFFHSNVLTLPSAEGFYGSSKVLTEASFGT